MDERHGQDVVRSVSVAVHTLIKERDELQYGTFGGLPVLKHTSTPGLRVMTCILHQQVASGGRAPLVR